MSIKIAIDAEPGLLPEPLSFQESDYQKSPKGFREWLFIATLCSTQFFVQGAFGYILIPLNLVGQTFSQDASQTETQMAWHIGAYSLTVGTFILFAGKLGDIYGSKRILILGWTWFGIWSVIGGCSAFTSSPIFFDIARAFQGIGPALLLPNVLAIAGRTYPPESKKKRLIFSIFALAAPLGTLTAGAIGSAFAQYVWWPWVMWVYSMGCFVNAVIASWVIPQDIPFWTPNDPEQKIDWIGAILGVSGLLLLNVSWNQAPIDGWQTQYVYTLLILGFLCLFAFVLHERRVKIEPILNITIFNRHAAAVLLTTGLGWSSFGIWFYYTFRFIQRFRGVSPLESAAQFAPGAISGIVAAIATSWLIRAVPHGWLMTIACGAFLAGCILQALAPVEQSYWFNTFWSFVIMAWGMDISFPASATVLSDAVPAQHQGLSASLVNTVINYSIAVTVESHVNDNGKQVLQGYRAAFYTSIGLAGLGCAVAIGYVAILVDRGSTKEEE
ncbi:MFS multidrug transporter, putative [Talaromyces stipitatus ATCC 10500]|uniref:MFS multidrug transporter, putative n=1 Tax=Talaromyces stipitatus (strain ATCC 10500 / CBS 375.48 / QM 6759 / NRRL 1006) TaxID=441959 RepID=B8MHP4_TALSN|nr:MFS multidrug transporter, putative [Talaromyces stipitatus ATCC 10500]EED16025.1 MFS multidrug transporter, putative [Talaromyces stipitatus ATCC 10500]